MCAALEKTDFIQSSAAKEQDSILVTFLDKAEAKRLYKEFTCFKKSKPIYSHMKIYVLPVIAHA